MNYERYAPPAALSFPERTWPEKTITKAPRWCSVDLRDGNQALIKPMSVEEKLEYFKMLCDIGFKEIEVGFPAASSVEYDFIRRLIDEKLIPDDVYIQVMTQCKRPLIERTFEAIAGAENVIFNIYNSISTLQRDVVFHKDSGAVKKIAMDAARWIRDIRWETEFEGNFVFEYTAESFTGADLSFALNICEAVKTIWNPHPIHNPMIITIPSTIEDHTPNAYADMVEWMSTHLSGRENFALCIHPHNDRGTGVAAAEMGLLAGADRIEGTLFGNGERSGNCDLMTLAYNMFSHGMDPELDLQDEPKIQEVYERCTGMTVSDRHPYAGKLVFTAFSGSHQDAINKGIHMMEKDQNGKWAVPYLPIDPSDIGRRYESIVRINSQSGKGGVAFIMEQNYGFQLPKGLKREFAGIIQELSEKDKKEIQPAEIYDVFVRTYIKATNPLEFVGLNIVDTAFDHGERETIVDLRFRQYGEEHVSRGLGTGPLDASLAALEEYLGVSMNFRDFSEHSLTEGSNAEVIAYLELFDKDGNKTYGVGRSSNSMKAEVRALFSAANRLFYSGE